MQIIGIKCILERRFRNWSKEAVPAMPSRDINILRHGGWRWEKSTKSLWPSFIKRLDSFFLFVFATLLFVRGRFESIFFIVKAEFSIGKCWAIWFTSQRKHKKIKEVKVPEKMFFFGRFYFLFLTWPHLFIERDQQHQMKISPKQKKPPWYFHFKLMDWYQLWWPIVFSLVFLFLNGLKISGTGIIPVILMVP